MIGRKVSPLKRAKRMAIGGTVLAAAGFVAGILAAPKSGQETRRNIKDTVDRNRNEAEKELKRLHTELTTTIDETKKSTKKLTKKAQTERDDLVNMAKDTKEKAREIISAVHEGSADDVELQRAIRDANKTLDHLRKFLKR